jgi:hypothetical protein
MVHKNSFHLYNNKILNKKQYYLMKNTLDKKIKIQYDVIRKLEITNQK